MLPPPFHWTARAITHGQNSFELTEKSFLIDGKMCWIAGANTHVWETTKTLNWKRCWLAWGQHTWEKIIWIDEKSFLIGGKMFWIAGANTHVWETAKPTKLKDVLASRGQHTDGKILFDWRKDVLDSRGQHTCVRNNKNTKLRLAFRRSFPCYFLL